MVRLTSKSTGSSGFDDMASFPGQLAKARGEAAKCTWCGWHRFTSLRVRSAGSQSRTPARSVAGVSAERRADRDGESDPGERVVASGVGDRHDHANGQALSVQQRTA